MVCPVLSPPLLQERCTLLPQPSRRMWAQLLLPAGPHGSCQWEHILPWNPLLLRQMPQASKDHGTEFKPFLLPNWEISGNLRERFHILSPAFL